MSKLDENYNDLVLKYVVSNDTDSFNVTCPECGKQAIQSSFEAVDSGCLNQHHSIACQHCGYSYNSRDY